ncbi:hypothetical protein ACFWOG_10200 [Kitasatospora sp. NPDC058406]|uniref:hypothetical protein n=1 Tax=Kitasatospora sp. NPDC058406 TaxID=3346483 RepID=UPI00364901F5
MTSETASVAPSGQDSVVVASFDTHQHAERMLASLGRGFRKKAAGVGTTAVVIRGNADGSLRLNQSRVLTAGGLTDALFRVALAWTVGFMGLVSTLKGAKVGAHAAGVRQRHVGSDAQRIHSILVEAGPRAAIALVRCKDAETRGLIAAAAAERAKDCWDGSLTEFLATLDPGRAHDWVRTAVGEPSEAHRDR